VSKALQANSCETSFSPLDSATPFLLPQIAEAERFLALLDGAAEGFTFQVFADGANIAGKTVLPWNRSGKFPDIASALIEANNGGAGVYVTINETDLQGRKTENVTRVRAVFVDIDEDPDGTKRQAILECELAPHIIVESSPQKTHAYWLVSGLELSEFGAVQKSISLRFKGDPNVCDLPRVMRLPGFVHRKSEPVQSRILQTNDAPPYSVADLLTAFPKSQAALSGSQDASPGGLLREAPTEFVDSETIRSLRSALLSMRSDDRALWIKVGCALRSLGDVGRGLWLDWSATSETHRPVEDARTWDGLGHDRIGYRAVFAEAQRQGWVNSRSKTSAPLNFPARRVVAVDANALLSHAFPPREMLLAPWLQSQSLSMIYAWRGVGKTHVALAIAHALATGGKFLGWRAPHPVPVLYLDGEMPGVSLQDRIARIMRSETPIASDYLKFVTPDLQENGIMPNLADKAGQDAIEAVLGEAKVIIVDNLSCLARTDKENEAEGWLPLADWSLRMRATGHSVVFIHHAGKGGQQRGTSKREDLLDTVIALKRPSDYRPEQGARFEMHIEKTRALYGQEVVPLEVALATKPDGEQEWTCKPVEAVAEARMIELANEGLSQADIARELNCHRSTVMRALRNAEAEGRYKPNVMRKGNISKLQTPTGASDPKDILKGLRVAHTKARNTQQRATTKPKTSTKLSGRKK
jgi:hypothetical protein